jgi:DNA-binding NarL/FixJ family response regulator
MSVVRKIRVFVADDSIVLRERVLEMLREIPGVEVLGCAEDGLHAIACIRELKPDAVVLDIQMPCGNGLDVLKNIKHDGRGPVMIVFTNFPYPQYRKRALESGAEHFFDKTTEFEKLRELFGQLTGVLEHEPH